MDSQELYQVVVDYAEAHGMRLWPAAEGKLVGMIGGKHGRWLLELSVRGPLVAARSIFSVIAPPERQAAVMEYMTWANYGLPVGRFELDLRDGEIGFWASLFIADGILTQEMVGCLVGAALGTTDHYLPALLRVLYAGQEPALAYRQTMQPGAATPEGDGALAELLSGLEQTLEQLGDPTGD